MGKTKIPGSFSSTTTVGVVVALPGPPIGIQTDRGTILDGGNRAHACQASGRRPPQVCILDGPYLAVDSDIAPNLNRRHPSTRGRAPIPVLLESGPKEQAPQRIRAGEGPESMENVPRGAGRDIAAEMAGHSGKTVDGASKIRAKGLAERVEAVRTGTIGDSAAAKSAERPKEEQIEVSKNRPVAAKKMAESLRAKKKGKSKNSAGKSTEKSVAGKEKPAVGFAAGEVPTSPQELAEWARVLLEAMLGALNSLTAGKKSSATG